MIYETTFKVFIVFLLISSCEKPTASGSGIRFTKRPAIDTIPFHYGPNGHMLINVLVDSISYALALDTGSSTSLFQNDLKIPGQHIAFDPENPSTGTNINGEKFLMSYGTIIQKLGLGSINVLNLAYNRVKFNVNNADGILGNNILQYFVFKIDFHQSEIVFAKDVANFDLEDYESFPLSFPYASPFINVDIAGKPFSLLIDTGNPVNFISLNNKERRHFNPKEYRIHNWKTLRQPTPFDTIWALEQEKTDPLGFTETDIQLGNYQLTDHYIQFSNFPTSQVGLDFLGQFGSVIFDYQNKMIYLAKTKNRMSISQLLNVARYVNSNGVVFSQDSIHKTVISISQSTEKQGIKLHDTLVSLGGRDMKKKLHRYPNSDLTITSNVLIDNFNYTMGNRASTIEIKSPDGIKKHLLKRQYPLTVIPDTVQSFGLSSGYIYLAPTFIQNGNYFEYKVRQLPADIRDLNDSLPSLN